MLIVSCVKTTPCVWSLFAIQIFYCAHLKQETCWVFISTPLGRCLDFTFCSIRLTTSEYPDLGCWGQQVEQRSHEEETHSSCLDLRSHPFCRDTPEQRLTRKRSVWLFGSVLSSSRQPGTKLASEQTAHRSACRPPSLTSVFAQIKLKKEQTRKSRQPPLSQKSVEMCYLTFCQGTDKQQLLIRISPLFNSLIIHKSWVLEWLYL